MSRIGAPSVRPGTGGMVRQSVPNLAAITAAASAAAPVLVWNGKTATFTRHPLENSFIVEADPPRHTNVSLSGANFESILDPRVEVMVRAEWILADWDLRWQLEDWWQWAKQGNSFVFAYDSDNMVATTLAAEASAGASAVQVASETDITASQYYAIADGPYRQIVKVDSINGSPVTVNLSGTLDNTFQSGATFWDLFYFSGRIADPRARAPFRDRFIRSGTNPVYRFELEFVAYP